MFPSDLQSKLKIRSVGRRGCAGIADSWIGPTCWVGGHCGNMKNWMIPFPISMLNCAGAAERRLVDKACRKFSEKNNFIKLELSF